MKKAIRKHFGRTAILLVILSFIFGLVVGRISPQFKSEKVESLLKESELDTESFIVEQELLRSLGESGCPVAQKRANELSHKIYEMARFLSEEGMEEDLGEEGYSLFKKRYHLLQLRTYILLQSLNERCGSEYHTILFYYGEDDSASQEQGRILDTFVEEEEYQVFPIQYNYSPQLEFMELYYDVTTTPTLIIDFTHKSEGLTSAENVLALQEGIDPANPGGGDMGSETPS